MLSIRAAVTGFAITFCGMMLCAALIFCFISAWTIFREGLTQLATPTHRAFAIFYWKSALGVSVIVALPSLIQIVARGAKKG